MIPISADMKLQRAHVHLDALNVKVSAWINSKPYTITPETDFQRGEYVITTVIQDVPHGIQRHCWGFYSQLARRS
jgi:hypothetical protein